MDRVGSGVQGVDHVAYVTFEPEATIRFYRDILGFPLVHCILAPAWGNEDQPDFAHFFFDIGQGARLAFFYYFGEPSYCDPNVSQMLSKARHVAIRVDSEEALHGFARRLADAGWPMRHGRAVAHELIESIYVYDPNGYNIEFSRPLRSVAPAEIEDAQVTVRALVDVVRGPDPSLVKVWQRKGELIASQDV